MNISVQLKDVTTSPLPQLAERPADSHKGTFGHVLVIGGSRNMPGAPALAGMAALRSGAGLVTLAVPRSIQSTVASYEPSYMTIGIGVEDEKALLVDHLEELTELSDSKTVVALGPGLATAPETKELVCELYEKLQQPMIVDADALNALAEQSDVLPRAGGVRILTPHPGEFQRLTGQTMANDGETRTTQAAQFCQQLGNHQAVVVLKGNQTIVTDGKKYSINTTGNPGMATGGSGDCLTGVISALIGQGLTGWDAARLGVYVHGLSGDQAAQELGQVSLVASDLIDYLPTAFCELQSVS